MKRILKQKTFWLAVAAFLMLGGTGLSGAMAYFTTHVAAKGGYPITLGAETSVEEEVEDMTKHIVLVNTGENDCYVRVKVFCGSQFTIDYSTDLDDGSEPCWKLDEGDGYWYYQSILPAGEKTRQLLAKIEIPKDYTESFDIIVIQECTPALYQEDGTPYADWENKIDTKTDIGVAQEEGDR